MFNYKQLLKVAFIGVMWLATALGGFSLGKQAGVQVGVEAYHRQCTIGGIIVGSDGTVVGCQPLGKLSQPELESFKNNSKPS